MLIPAIPAFWYSNSMVITIYCFIVLLHESHASPKKIMESIILNGHAGQCPIWTTMLVLKVFLLFVCFFLLFFYQHDGTLYHEDRPRSKFWYSVKVLILLLLYDTEVCFSIVQELYCFVPDSVLLYATLSVCTKLTSTYIWQAKLLFF